MGAGALLPPVILSLQELPDQQLNSRDVPPHLEDRAILLRVRKVERVHSLRPHVLLPNDAWRWETDLSRAPSVSHTLCPLLRPPSPAVASTKAAQALVLRPHRPARRPRSSGTSAQSRQRRAEGDSGQATSLPPNTTPVAPSPSPVRTPARLSSSGRLCTRSKEL